MIIEPLLSSPLHAPLITRLKENTADDFVVVDGLRAYEGRVNTLAYEGDEARLLLLDSDGEVLNFTTLESLTDGVVLSMDGNLVLIDGIQRYELFKCRAVIDGSSVYFNVRFT